MSDHMPISQCQSPVLTFTGSVLSGSISGLAVDLSLYPIDTLKTRLQSSDGFWRSGGLRRLYAGLTSVAVGSAPSAALFFITYDGVRKYQQKEYSNSNSVHMNIMAACTAECVACLVRVPTEVVKQRAQSLIQAGRQSTWQVAKSVVQSDGLIGFYRGFRITIMRELPFAVVQYPLWEILKTRWQHRQQQTLHPVQGALCGSVAGMLAGALTTPLDLCKTRIMLANSQYGRALSAHQVLTQIYETKGVTGLYSGGLTRSLWLGLGGLVYFGAYEHVKYYYLQYQQGSQFTPTFALWDYLTTPAQLTNRPKQPDTFDEFMLLTEQRSRAHARNNTVTHSEPAVN